MKRKITIAWFLLLLVALVANMTVGATWYKSVYIPTTNATESLGSVTYQFLHAYISGNLTFGQNSGGLYPTNNSTPIGSVTYRPDITADYITNSGNITNSGGIYPTNNTTGLGSSTYRFDAVLDTINASGTSTFSGAIASTGTLTVSNHSSGTANITAGETSVNITHALGSTPIHVFLSLQADPFATSNITSVSIYWSSANTTTIVANSTASNNVTTQLNWLAFIVSE